MTIRGSQSRLAEGYRRTLQSAIERFAELEQISERAAAASEPPRRPDKLNDIVSGQIDEVHAVLLALRETLRSEQ